MESLSDYMRLKCFVWTCDDSQGLRSIGIALDLLRANACTENFDISFSSEIKIKLVVFSFIIFYFVIASTQRRVNETLRSVEQNFVRCIQKCYLTRTSQFLLQCFSCIVNHLTDSRRQRLFKSFYLYLRLKCNVKR